MKLEDLGYHDQLENYGRSLRNQGFELGRIVMEHKERYVVVTEKGELEAEITGNMRYTAKSREDFPAVGDWVALTVYDSQFSIIHQVLPRFSILSRQAVGHFGEIQIIATNIDFGFLVQAVDRDFNLNRLERYLTICYAAKVSPIIVLTKTDLITEQQLMEILENLQQRLKDIPVVAISNETQEGIDALKKYLERGKTYCMLGSSGVGKSSLLNNLSGRSHMKTNAISQSTQKGRHVTTHRELMVLETGGILIDNPGMREVGIVDSAHGLETTFDQIVGLAQHCKFKDCTHTAETGCSVRKALETGELDRGAYENYLKMEREKGHFESSVAERRKRDKKFGKMMKNYKKDVGKNKF